MPTTWGMPYVAGQPAINTLLELLTGSPAVYRPVANLGDITGPAFSLALVDVTSHSTSTPWDAFVGTIFSGGDIGFPLFFIPSSGDTNVATDPLGHDAANGIMSVFLARAVRTWQMVFPDTAGTTAGPLSAVMYKFNWKAMVKDVLRADTTVRITGQPALTF